MNLSLMNGLVDALQHPTLEARLEPSPERCCGAGRTPVVDHSMIDKG
jgi:hypothetical protein